MSRSPLLPALAMLAAFSCGADGLSALLDADCN